MNWIEIAVKTTTEGAEIIAEALYGVGIAGVIIQDPHDIELFKGRKTDWDYVDESLAYDDHYVVVKGYLSDTPSFHESLHTIRERLGWLLNQDLGVDIGPCSLGLSNVREEDWANNWKKYFKPKRIGRRIVIKPSWEEYASREGDIVLELDPGMAFGTGTHETTILCIEALEEWVKPGGMALLDIGCGTGILAIAGLLLGAEKASLVDRDMDAIGIAKKNVLRNGVGHRAEVIQGDLMDKVKGEFEIIVSNIIADAIIDISRSVKKYLKLGGIFISSGIILDRLPDVKLAMERSGLSILDIKTFGEWAAVVSKYE